VKLLLLFALALPLPHQEGPFRRQIGENHTTIVLFNKPFDTRPKCIALPAGKVVVGEIWLDRVEVVGRIGAGFEVTCYEGKP